MTAPEPIPQNTYSFYETVKPPPTEALVVSYLQPLMAPLRILTRLPPQDETKDTPQPDTYIRIEASGGRGDSMSGIYTLQIILHSYAPFFQEVTAEDNIATAIAWMGNGLGSTVYTQDGYPWYIIDSNVLANMHRLTDPRTPLTRYRAVIMWAVEGNVMAPIGSQKLGTPRTPENPW